MLSSKVATPGRWALYVCSHLPFFEGILNSLIQTYDYHQTIQGLSLADRDHQGE